MFDYLQSHGLQHARPPCPSPTPGAYSNSCPLSWWCHPTISSFVVPSPPAFNLSQHQVLFQWVSSSHQVAKILEFQLQHHQSFHWIFRTDCATRLDGKGKCPREAELSRSTSSQSQEAQSPTSSHARLWPLNKRSLERIPGAYEIGKRKNYFFIVINLSLTY